MVLNALAVFCLLVFFCWNDFSHTKKINHALAVPYYNIPPPPYKFDLISPVVTIKEGMETKKQVKMKIGVGSVVKAKVGELENITREGISRMTRKDVVICVQSVVGNNNFLVQLEYGQNKEISSSLLVFLSSKYRVEMDEAISHSPEKEQGELLTIFGCTEVK